MAAMMQPMLDLFARAMAAVVGRCDRTLTGWAHRYHVQKGSVYEWCAPCESATAPAPRSVPPGIEVGVPSPEDVAIYHEIGFRRQTARPGQIIVATNVSLYDTDRFTTCEQCATPLALAGDWPLAVFVVCDACARSMAQVESQLDTYTRNEAMERSARARRHLAPVIQRH